MEEEVQNRTDPSFDFDENSDNDDIKAFMEELESLKHEDDGFKFGINGYTKTEKESNDENIDYEQINGTQPQPKLRKQKKRMTLVESSVIRKKEEEPKEKSHIKKIKKSAAQKMLDRLSPLLPPPKKPEPVRRSVRPPPKTEEEIQKANKEKIEQAYKKHVSTFISNSFLIDEENVENLNKDQLEMCLSRLGILNYPDDSKAKGKRTHLSDFSELEAESEEWRVETDRPSEVVYSSEKAQTDIQETFFSEKQTPFAKLVKQSISLCMMNGKGVVKSKKAEDPPPPSPAPKPTPHAELKADEEFNNKVNGAFPNKKIISEEELNVILKQLGIISSNVHEKFSIVEKELESWEAKGEGTNEESEEDSEITKKEKFYYTEKVQSAINESMTSKQRTEFQTNVKVRLMVTRANGGIGIKKTEKKEEEKPAKKVVMSKEHLDKLAEPRPETEEEKMEKKRQREKWEQEEKEWKARLKRREEKRKQMERESEFHGMSEYSREILSQKWSNSKMEDRDKEYSEHRKARLEKLEKEINKNEGKKKMKHRTLTDDEAKIYRENCQRYKERREERLMKEIQQPFKPQLSTDIARVKQLLEADVQKPPGWEADVQRRLEARKKYLEKKQKHQQIIDPIGASRGDYN